MPLKKIDITTDHGTWVGDVFPVAFTKTNDNDEYLEQLAEGAYDHADSAYRKDNILGTVGQAGGVPTGAIIQQGGATSTGRYVRYADGTQICYGQLAFTMQNGTFNWQVIYAASFASPTAANVQIIAGNSLARKMGVENIDTTNCAGFYENLAGASGAVLHYVAVGRWY